MIVEERKEKRPAFWFYPKDFLTDQKVLLMNAEARGVYITLLCQDWLEDGIPSDPIKWVDLGGLFKGDQVRSADLIAEVIKMLKPCFFRHPKKRGFVTNPRVQSERKRLDAYQAIKSAAGKIGNEKRWGSDKSIAVRSACDDYATRESVANDRFPSSSSNKDTTKDSSEGSKSPAEPEQKTFAELGDVVLIFPTVGREKKWFLTSAVVDQLSKGFPAVDVRAEAAKALAWCQVNVTRQKTAKGMPKFLYGWMERTQNSARGAGSQNKTGGEDWRTTKL